MNNKNEILNTMNLADLALTQGIELTPEQMQSISGGRIIDWDHPFDLQNPGSNPGKPSLKTKKPF